MVAGESETGVRGVVDQPETITFAYADAAAFQMAHFGSSAFQVAEEQLVLTSNGELQLGN